MTTYVLAFYDIDRAYGGPEEGGWWYDTGQLVRVWRTLKSEEPTSSHAVQTAFSSICNGIGETSGRSSIMTDATWSKCAKTSPPNPIPRHDRAMNEPV